MKQRDVDANAERLFLTGLIVSDKFLREALTFYQPELMGAPWARTVADWCAAYYDKYGKAPDKHIQQLYWARREHLPEGQGALIEELLAGLSNEYERGEGFNTEYVLDRAERYFKSRALERLSENIQNALLTDNLEDADSLLLEYRAPQRPTSVGINPFTDENAVRDAYEFREQDILLRLPGALGKFVGPIVREDFVGVLGPEKRGKSFWLEELGMWGVRAKRNVALLGIGDMSLMRYVQRVHNYLSRTHHYAHGQVEKYPVLDCRHNQTGECGRAERTGTYAVSRHNEEGTIITPYEEAKDHKPCRYCEHEDPKAFKGAVWYAEKRLLRPKWQDLIKVGHKLEKTVGRNRMRLACWPGGLINVRGIRAQLDHWEHYEGWVPDIVIVDYADVLGPENAQEREYRHRKNDTWAALRALAQERRCVVITATQASAAGREKATLSERDWSEDKRVLAHVTMMLTLNQTAVEKERKVLRVGRLAVRDDGYDSRKYVHVLECREMGRPHLASYF